MVVCERTCKISGASHKKSFYWLELLRSSNLAAYITTYFIKEENTTKVFFFSFCEIFKNSFIHRTLSVSAC